MEAAFRSKIDKKLVEYREWSRPHYFSARRLVHYCGVELVGSKGIFESDVEAVIEGLVCEGFYVDWADNEDTLYLRVWEFDGPVPDWPSVFAERPLAPTDEG